MIKKLSQNEILYSVGLIVLTTLLTYGVLIPRLGFYRDDWYMIWTAQALGPQGVLDLFKGDRPFIGVLYAFDYSVLGKAVLNWHLYALAIKLAGGLALFWLLRMIWPDRKAETTFITVLFIIYPGFYQQANAATFKNLLLSQTAVMSSLALTVFSVKTKSRILRVPAILMAILLGAFYLAIYESMIGLEAARFIFLWLTLRKTDPIGHGKNHFVRTMKWFSPYLMLAVGFAFWRLFLFDSTRRATSINVILGEYVLSPQHSLIVLVSEFLKDMLETSIFAWSVPFYNFTQYIERYRDFGNTLLLAAIVAGIALAYIRLCQRRNWIEEDDRVTNGDSLDYLVIGLLIVVITTIPIIAAGRNVIFGLQWDRYTAQSTLGAALFATGFVFYALRRPTRWFVLLGLIGVGVATQYLSAVTYRDFWNIERSMWWQLSWRVPDFEPGTTVIGVAPRGYRYAEEYEVWGPLNMIYNPGGPIKINGQILYNGIEVDMAAGKLEERNNRNILIERDYGKAVIASMPSPASCLHVIDGRMLELPSFEDPAVAAAAPYSKIELVLGNGLAHTPPGEVFGPEPQRGWCYYYEKMDLAHQTESWQEIIQLGVQAQSLDLVPNDTSEWMPLYVAYINAGELDQAKQLVKRMKADREMQGTLCLQIERTVWPASYDSAAIRKTLCGKVD